MTSGKLLDCTLRDGAYLIDKKFGNDVINALISGLIETGIEFVEIGFLQNEGFGDGKTVFKNSMEAEKFIPKCRGNSIFTVLADYSRYSISNLDDYTGKSFDAVRACFFKNERYDVINFMKEIKRKGYKLFVQPVDAMGYTDTELIELIHMINEVEPYCFSIVDTFGSMYKEDLQRIYSLVEHNLSYSCQIGFHSHNNMQMSSALAQDFMNISYGHRNVIVDATISGMGRGAGNTPTELIAQYMVTKLGYHYDMDVLLDLIDNYIEPIKARASWGYDTYMFLAGAYSAHVNNISYLKKKNSIRSKDIRFIFSKVNPIVRKRYQYDLLEDIYINYLESDIDDSEDIEQLRKELSGKNIAIIAPGNSATLEKDKIIQYTKKKEAITISINFIPDFLSPDYLYMSNVHRYETFRKKEIKFEGKKIFTSNVVNYKEKDAYIISFRRLYKCGWQLADNSTILLLRLLHQLGAKNIGIAGLDGYDIKSLQSNHYAEKSLELPVKKNEAMLLNKELKEMLEDFCLNSSTSIEFITHSRFE